MSVTNANVLYDALKAIGVIHEGGTLSAEQGLDGLRRMNQVMETWTEDHIELGYFAQSDTTATCPIPAWAEMGVTSKVAQRLMADYPSATPQPWLFDDAQNGIGTIVRKVIVENAPVAKMDHMPSGTGHHGAGFDITR